MSTKKYKDPADLLPDAVKVELDGDPSDFDAVARVLKSNAPGARIERLRRHPQLIGVADELATRYIDAGSKADMRLLLDLSNFEYKALYLDAAPKVINGDPSKAGKRAAKARWACLNDVKQLAFDRRKEHAGLSRSAAIDKFLPEVVKACRDAGKPLTGGNPKRTVTDWFRKAGIK